MRNRILGVAAMAFAIGCGAEGSAQAAPSTSGGMGALTAKRAFVTSVRGSGDLSSWPGAGGQTGVAAGDAICAALARAAGLEPAGDFRAWLSDGADDAYCRVLGLHGKKAVRCGRAALPDGGPWTRTDGTPFAAALSRMLAPTYAVYAAPTVDERGSAVGFDRILTGTEATGEASSGSAYRCDDWTSTTGNARGGWTTATGAFWTSAGWLGTASAQACANPGRLLCLEIGAGAAIAPPSPAGKLAFVTSARGAGNLGAWPDAGGKSGLTGADAICASRAQAGGLANAARFKAWLSDGSTGAEDRITSDGPWVRPDGVRIAASRADLAAGTLLAPLDVTEASAYVPGNALDGSAWTGTAVGGKSSGATCEGWTSPSGGSIGTASLVDDVRWSASVDASCSSAFALYCLED
jgi:hypothetical protein